LWGRGAVDMKSGLDLGRNAILDMAALLPELSRVDLSGVSHALLTPATAAVTTVRIPTVLFGPGDIGLMHQTDERVPVQDIIAASRVLALLPVRLL
jgi:acetylornithine deacetylase/succinyl-diaminopimelate desuccinylase-like protein